MNAVAIRLESAFPAVILGYPQDRVFDYLPDVFVIVDGERLVAGLKIKNSALPAGKGAAAAENLSARKPAYK